MTYPIQLGKISPCLQIDQYTVRCTHEPPGDEGDNDGSTYQAQGHLTNVTDYSLDNLVIDISYYNKNGDFLGLDKTGLFNVDEMDPRERVPFDITLDIPEETQTCELNASARIVTGWWARMFLGAKK